jgi:hypothetical protein
MVKEVVEPMLDKGQPKEKLRALLLRWMDGMVKDEE